MIEATSENAFRRVRLPRSGQLPASRDKDKAYCWAALRLIMLFNSSDSNFLNADGPTVRSCGRIAIPPACWPIGPDNPSLGPLP